MKAIGLGAGLLAFLAAALSAEAQVNIQGINPTATLTSDQSTTYVGQITGASGAYWKLSVLLNGQERFAGTLCYVTGTAPFNVSQYVSGMGGWGLAEGQTINYMGKIGTTPLKLKNCPWAMLVDDPTTYVPVRDSRTTPSGLRQEFCAAMSKEEEELLA